MAMMIIEDESGRRTPHICAKGGCLAVCPSDEAATPVNEKIKQYTEQEARAIGWEPLENGHWNCPECASTR